MKLSTIQKDDIAVVPQVSRENVRLLWSNDWYDGPLTGIAEVNGVKFLFDIVDRNVLGAEEDRPRGRSHLELLAMVHSAAACSA